MAEEKRMLPKIQDLHHDLTEAFKTDQLNLLLNQPPKKEWVKEHPFAKNVRYIPIDKVEFLLTKIFGEWKAEVREVKQLFNSVSVTVRLHYRNPLNGEWSYHDGVGAVGVQTDKGASASDLSAIKQDAIMKALPSAKSYATKDAAENLGTLFGKDLNRKDTLGFEASYKEIPVDENHEQYKLLYDRILKGISTVESLEPPFKLTESALEALKKVQVYVIKLFCEQAKLPDEEKNQIVMDYMNEDASAEAIINGMKEKYGIKFLNSL